MSDGKKVLMEAGDQGVIEQDVTQKIVVIKSDGVDPESYGKINDSVVGMGARGALIVGSKDQVEAIDPYDKLVILIAKDLPDEATADEMSAILQENGAIAFLAVPSPAHLLALSDDDLAKLNLQRISDRRKHA